MEYHQAPPTRLPLPLPGPWVWTPPPDDSTPPSSWTGPPAVLTKAHLSATQGDLTNSNCWSSLSLWLETLLKGRNSVCYLVNVSSVMHNFHTAYSGYVPFSVHDLIKFLQFYTSVIFFLVLAISFLFVMMNVYGYFYISFFFFDKFFFS